jgi:hypothetical protein
MASKFQIPIAFKSDPRGLQQAEGALAGFGKKLAGIGAAVAGAFAVRAVFNFGKEAVLAAEQVSTANNTLIAVAKATNAFGAETDKVTGQLIKFAKAQEMRIGVDENVVKSVQAQLLSFKAVGASAGEAGGAFERATKAAFDMAVVLKKDAGSQAIALGKALEDPIRGITALRRGGTTFTEQQQEQIKVLVQSNRMLEAQNLILTEVESQYGGAAEASANWSDKLRLAFGNVQEALGAALTPAFERFAKYVIENVIPPLTKFFEDDFPAMLQTGRNVLDALRPAFQAVGDALREAFDIQDGVSLFEGLLAKITAFGGDPKFVDFLKQSVEGFARMLPDLILLVPLMLQLLQEVVPGLISIFPQLIKVLGFFVDILAFVVGGASDTWDWFTKIDDALPKWAKGLEIIFDPIRVMSQLLKDLARDLQVVFDWWNRVTGKNIPGISAGALLAPNRGQGARAVGGPVTANRTYMVGERGPELFTPGAGGFITPNNRLGGNSGTTYNITVNAGMGVGNGAQLGEAIVSAIKRYERVSGPVFASA